MVPNGAGDNQGTVRRVILSRSSGLNGARRVPPVEMPVMFADQNGATATGAVE